MKTLIIILAIVLSGCCSLRTSQEPEKADTVYQYHEGGLFEQDTSGRWTKINDTIK